jgi:polyhydroxybutyrate depolymerase
VNGTADRHVPYEGGEGDESVTGVDFASVGESIEFWADRNDCNDGARLERTEGIAHLAYADCVYGTAVELYAVTDGLHAWPGSDGPGWTGGDQPTGKIDATQVIWEFFAAHPKP